MNASSNVLWRVAAAVVLASAAVASLGMPALAFATSGYKWRTSEIRYYVNPANRHVSDAAALYAVQRAASAWSEQADIGVAFVYGGTTNGASVTLNNRNEVFFRDDANGYVAETYWWYDGTGALVDADIVFHTASNRFFVGSGCADGIYIENVAVHEFGHALGLAHSNVPGATMAPAMNGYCDVSQLTLEPDDVAAAESVYPPPSSPVVPAAPSLLTVRPDAAEPWSTLVLAWTDNASNEQGYRVERSADGITFTHLAQLGANARGFTDRHLPAQMTFWYRVHAFNADGASGSSNTGSATTQALPVGPRLSATGFKIKGGLAQASLTWSGMPASLVDVYRNGVRVMSTPNDGAEIDPINRRGGGTYTYKACAAGTATCSNVVSVVF